MDLSAYIRDIPDWPKEGVVFKDITPLLASPEGFRESIDTLADAYADAGVTKVMGAEARGFIFGGALAYRLGAGFVPARKPGKLPWDTTSVTYDLEYGTDSLEVHADAIGARRRSAHRRRRARYGRYRRGQGAACDRDRAPSRGVRVPDRARLPRRPREAAGRTWESSRSSTSTDRSGWGMSAADATLDASVRSTWARPQSQPNRSRRSECGHRLTPQSCALLSQRLSCCSSSWVATCRLRCPTNAAIEAKRAEAEAAAQEARSAQYRPGDAVRGARADRGGGREDPRSRSRRREGSGPGDRGRRDGRSLCSTDAPRTSTAQVRSIWSRSSSALPTSRTSSHAST